MKPVVVEIAREPVENINWTDKKTGAAKHVGKQRAYMHGAGTYPTPFKLSLQDGESPFQPGFYMLAGECFAAGDFDSLKFRDRNFKLIPLEDALSVLTGLVKQAKAA